VRFVFSCDELGAFSEDRPAAGIGKRETMAVDHVAAASLDVGAGREGAIVGCAV